VQERIEALAPGTVTPLHASSPRSSLDPAHNQNRSTQTTYVGPQAAAAAVLHEQQKGSNHPPDDLWEIVCNDTVLPPNMTLAVVRQHVWRQSGEVVLHYRRKRPATHGKA
jgi:WD repeat-containing protein 48